MIRRWPRRLETVACGLILTALGLAAYARLFFGVSVGDEAFVVTMAYLPEVGGRWFVSDQSIIQMAGILVSPLAWIYGVLFGTTGMMLYFRHLELTLSVVVAIQGYWVLRRINRRAVAMILAALIVVFVPHNIATLSYNNLGSLLFGLATFSAIRALTERRRGPALLSGLSWTCCVFAYPSLLISFVVFAVALLVTCVREPARRRDFAAPFMLGLVLASVVLVSALVACGVDNVWATYEWSKEGSNAGQSYKLFYAIYLVGTYLPPAWITAPALLAWIILGFWSRLGAVAYGVFIALYFALGRNDEAPPSQVLWPILMAFALGLPVQRRFRFGPTERRLMWLVVVPAIAGALVTCLSSLMTLYATCLTGLFGGLAVTAMVVRRDRVLGFACALTLLTGSAYWRWAHMYEDGPIATLTTMVPAGPFAGLISFPEKVRWLAEIQEAFTTYQLHDRTIIIKDMFAAGYLMANNRPWGPVMWFGSAQWYTNARTRYVKVFSDPANWPEIVFDLAYYPATPSQFWVYNVPGHNQISDPFRDFFIKTGAYRIVADKTAYRILEKQK